jgi:hypothetical protein
MINEAQKYLNFTEEEIDNTFCIVVSFHKLKKNLKLLFNDKILEGEKDVN